MGYNHFTHFDRCCIEKLLPYGGFSQKEIAKYLGCDAGSVSREIRRNGGRDNYCANLAQNRYIEKRKLSQNISKLSDAELADYIKEKIKLHWSPEQISGSLKKDIDGIQISIKSIYRYINFGLINGIKRSNLRRKGKKRKDASVSKQKIIDAKKISERPKIANERKRIGDFEIDTVLSGRKNGSKACLLTNVERKSGYLIASKMPDKGSDSVVSAIKVSVKAFGKRIFKTITSDNGLEFARHLKIEKITNSKFYFADPHSPWQRGTNENTNGLIREFFPKGFDFATVEQSDIDRVVELINNRPRKRLGYKTPKEVFYNLKIALDLTN